MSKNDKNSKVNPLPIQKELLYLHPLTEKRKFKKVAKFIKISWQREVKERLKISFKKLV